MKSDHPSQAHLLIDSRPVGWTVRMVLAVCLLLFVFSGDAVAASGSTRLTIHIDQSVVDAIARWKGKMVQPPGSLAVGQADQVLQCLLPVARAGLEIAHRPQAVRQILQRLQQDALILREGRAEHAGGRGQACLSIEATGGVLTIHSI
jgi:hypothetical protein